MDGHAFFSADLEMPRNIPANTSWCNGQMPRAMLLLVIAWMVGLMFAPLGWAMTGNWLCWSVVYLLCVLQVGWLARRIGAFRWWTALWYPVPLVFFFMVFARSAMRGGMQVT